MTAAGIVYFLCFATCAVCAGLLVRAWMRSRDRLLFWSAISFVFLALNNLILFADRILLPSIDLTPYRYAAALIAVGAVVFAFVWEAE